MIHPRDVDVPLPEDGPVLPPEHRLRRRTDFTDAVRRGRRSSRPLLTVHALRTPDAAPARAGLVVGKAVGGSVVRHRVARRLRHQLREVLPDLPVGTLLVVRAAPAAATAPSVSLAADLRAAVDRVIGVRT